MIKLALGAGAFFLLSAAAVEVRSVFDLTSVPRVVADVRTEHGDRLPEGGLVIEVAEGETRLTHPLVFDASLSGEPGRPVVVRAMRRGASVVSGGTRLAWRSLRANEAPLLPLASREHVRVADVPGAGPLPGFTAGGLDRVSPCYETALSLFEGEERLSCARWPTDGFAEVPVGRGVPAKDWTNGWVRCLSPHLALWMKEPDLWVTGCWKYRWREATSRVLAVDGAGRQISVERPFSHQDLGEYPEYFVFNAFSEMTTPGRWVVDRTARRIYAWPKADGGRPVVALVDHLLVVSNAHDVAIEGFVFEHSREDAIVLGRCTNVTLAASCVRHTSSWGVSIRDGFRCRVEGCDLYDLGEGGVSLHGGETVSLTDGENIADNCHIRDFGKIVWNSRPGVRLEGVGQRATHNLVHHCPQIGILFNGGNHLVADNVVHDTCRHADDAGAIYGYMENWTGRGTVIENNCVHMTGDQPRALGQTFGIYLDAYSSDITVRGNIINRAVHGIFSSGGQGNTIERNVIVNSPIPLRRWNLGIVEKTGQPYADAGMGFRSSRFSGVSEMLSSPYGELWRRRYPTIGKTFAVAKERGAVFAHNALFVSFRDNALVASGGPLIVDVKSTADYTTLTNNVAFPTDSGFADYHGMDWSLRPDSPLRKFLRGDTKFAQMGLYADEKRFSPAVKFAPNVTAPRPFGPEPDAARVRIDVRVAEKDLKDGVSEFADALELCRFRSYLKGRLTADLGVARGEWNDYAFSFVPKYDATAELMLSGWYGECTAYDEVRAEGCEIANGGFEDESAWTIKRPASPLRLLACGFKDTDEDLPAAEGRRFAVSHYQMVFSQPIKLRKGVRVTIRYKARACATAAKTSVRPERGVYFATHFGNWYENASPEELEDYLKELRFWGCRAVTAWFDMHDYAGIDDPKAQKRLQTIRRIFAVARTHGMDANLMFLANEAFKDSPEALRADWRPGKNGYEKELSGHYHVEICPSRPGGADLILQWRRQVLEAFKSAMPSSVTIFPYDQGGCTCSLCAPWGANAYLKLSERLASLCREVIPGVKIHLSAWYFDTFGQSLGEWKGLFDQSEKVKTWADVISVHPADLPRMDARPFMPYVSMSEISMAGAYPWGGYGANPQPERLNREIAEHPGCAGLRPYSEGVFEDMNKVMVLAVLDGRAANTTEAVYQYAERYFGQGTGIPVCEAAALLEKNMGLTIFRSKVPLQYEKNGIPDRARAEQALSALERAEQMMTFEARASWRWRILKIRAEIDLSAARGEPPTSQRERFAELGRIYHVDATTLGHVRPPTFLDP